MRRGCSLLIFSLVIALLRPRFFVRRASLALARHYISGENRRPPKLYFESENFRHFRRILLN